MFIRCFLEPDVSAGSNAQDYGRNFRGRGIYSLLVIALAAILTCTGYVLLRTAPGVAKLAAATAAGVAGLSMVANLYVLPATSNTITLKDFALKAGRTIGGGKAAYLFGSTTTLRSTAASGSR